jgi:hypothetical protein
MDRTRHWRRWLGLALLCLASCKGNEPHLKPPPRPEEYVLPPDDSRYANPVEYPKNSLENGLKRDPDSKPNGPGAGPGPGMPSGAPGSQYQGGSRAPLGGRY